MRNLIRIILFLLGFSGIAVLLPAQRNAVLSTPNPSKEAKALFSYLNDMYGKKILSGQMWASWGYDELKYIKEVTGKQPAIRGMDFISSRENEDEVKRVNESNTVTATQHVL